MTHKTKAAYRLTRWGMIGTRWRLNDRTLSAPFVLQLGIIPARIETLSKDMEGLLPLLQLLSILPGLKGWQLLNLLMFFQVIGPSTGSGHGYGAISYAPNLDQVAERRIANEWGLQSIEGYDLLIAPADCSLLGRDGWLMVGDEVYTVIAVDCENGNHAGMMADRGLLLDQPREDLVSKYGWLVLR